MKDILLDKDLDIKDLKAVEVKGFVPVFEPEVELGSRDWESIEGFIKQMDSESKTNSGSLDYAVEAALYMQYLTGRRFTFNNATRLAVLRARLFDPEDYSDILVRESGGGSTLRPLKAQTEDLITELLLINPLFRGELRLENYRDVFESYFTDVDRRDDFYPLECLNARVILGESFNDLRVKGAKFFDPEYIKDDLKRVWQPDQFLSVFEPGTTSVERGLKYSDTVLNWVRILVCSKILIPGSELSSLNSRRWGLLKGWLSAYRLTDDPKKLLTLAAQLYLLSAEKIEVTDQGLVITPNTSGLIKPGDELPQVRSYA